MDQELLKEALEHQEILKDIRIVLSTQQGRSFIRYLMKSFDVGELPPRGVSAEFLMENLGFLRAGNSVFKIISEANPEIAGQLLAQIEKERHAKIYNAQTQQG